MHKYPYITTNPCILHIESLVSLIIGNRVCKQVNVSYYNNYPLLNEDSKITTKDQ